MRAIHPQYRGDLRLQRSGKQLNELADFDTEGGRPEDQLENVKKFLEENDLIRLLPGWVYGFALRNRKWGKELRPVNTASIY